MKTSERLRRNRLSCFGIPESEGCPVWLKEKCDESLSCRIHAREGVEFDGDIIIEVELGGPLGEFFARNMNVNS